MADDELKYKIQWLQEQLSALQLTCADLEDEITELRIENEDLLEREALSRAFVEQAPDSLYAHDLSGRLVFVNDLFCMALGYTKEEILKMSVHDLEYGVRPEQRQSDWDDVMAGITVHTEGLFKCKDGSTNPVDIRIGLFDVLGNRLIYGIARDLSERKKFEAMLLENEARYRALTEQAFEEIYLLDTQLYFKDVNQTACHNLGYTRIDLLELNLSDINEDLANKGNAEYIHGKLNKEERYTFSTHHKKKNGDLYPVEMCFSVIYFGGSDMILASGRDISERVTYEERLRQAHKLEAVGTLAGGIAHDFNNILGIILGGAELAGDSLPDEHPSHEYLKEIRLTVLRAKEVVRQLLSYSQKSDQTQMPLSIAPLIKESLKLMRATISANIELVTDIAVDCYMVMVNPAQIHQLMINLCANAAYAARDGGGIEVTLNNRVLNHDDVNVEANGLNGKFVQLTVRDTGCGMAPDHLERIFDPYFTTKDVGKGSGMGLAVVHGIIQRLGGVINVESELGKGTTFDIFLPGIEMTNGQTALAENEDASFPTGSERVLVVDDEPLIVDWLKERLERLGYVVEGFTSPLEALELFMTQPHQFDLLITDMAMPKMTGETLTAKVREIRNDFPVILCTGYSERIDDKTPQEIGAAKIILKPIGREELAVVAREVLDVYRSRMSIEIK